MVGGKTNTSTALRRHLASCSKAALIWVGPDGLEALISFNLS